MLERLRTRLTRFGFNLFPAFWSTGARITHLSPDFREIRIRLPLSWRTRNYVGTIFGGSMYAAVDPIYMVMLIRNLGPGYVVWDKAATIRFRKPGRAALFANFSLDQRELDDIRAALASEAFVERVYDVDLVDDLGVVHASVRKTLHIRRRGEGKAT
ncbi:MAG TPA: DUF4442 domain-containing protein [Longimicrobiales bacterium]|nr:DUF4442 domain-containing protein [Longimicrobiales bacterium]